jgi:acyl-CoA reductase-like NAD-dependent aldehyde dehydrogenase
LVWTRDLAVTKKVFDRVHAGIIRVNRHITVPPEVSSGGTLLSGIGRRNGHHAPGQYFLGPGRFFIGG